MSRILHSNLAECRGKLAFRTHKEARAAADTLSKRYLINSYHCTACGSIHNGKAAHSDEKRPRVPSYEARSERRYGCAEIRSEA